MRWTPTPSAAEAKQDLQDRFGVEPIDLNPKVFFRITDNWLELTVRFVLGTHPDPRGQGRHEPPDHHRARQGRNRHRLGDLRHRGFPADRYALAPRAAKDRRGLMTLLALARG